MIARFWTALIPSRDAPVKRLLNGVQSTDYLGQTGYVVISSLEKRYALVKSMQDKSAIVLKAIKDAKKPLKAGEISQMTGLSSEEVTKIVKALMKDGKAKSPSRCFYSPA